MFRHIYAAINQKAGKNKYVFIFINTNNKHLKKKFDPKRSKWWQYLWQQFVIRNLHSTWWSWPLESINKNCVQNNLFVLHSIYLFCVSTNSFQWSMSNIYCIAVEWLKKKMKKNRTNRLFWNQLKAYEWKCKKN